MVIGLVIQSQRIRLGLGFDFSFAALFNSSCSPYLSQGNGRRVHFFIFLLFHGL